jgi:2-methylcitrate dehydratase PrpD
MAEKTGASGKDVLAAIALGYEAAGRINTGVIPGLIWEKGFHGCMIAIFGGAVAAGLLLKLDLNQMTNALGLAATSNAGLLAAANTSMAREHHAGLAAMLGVEAAQLAGLGYTVEQSVLEHPRGFFSAYGQDAHASGRVADVTRGLGDNWKILTDMAIKLVPGGHPYHAIGEAAANAARMGDVQASDITAIICSRPNSDQIKGPRYPTELIGVAHSPYYFAAAGAADREFNWTHASPEKIMNPTIRRLLDLVEIGEPPTENVDRYKQGATVTVKTRDGRSFTNTVYAPRGSAVNGIEWSDVQEKFSTLCPLAGVSQSNVEKCCQVLRHFRDVKHMRELTDLID